MIFVRAPLRISFGGGGTDLPAYYEQHGGLVVSAAITRYSYALIERAPGAAGSVFSADYGLRFSWTPSRLPAVQPPLALPKAALRDLAERGTLYQSAAISLASDVPPGSGLGSSSAMAVALAQALASWYETPLRSHTAADRACALEIGRLGMPIGKQDQYASAYGGVNTIEFTANAVRVTPLRLACATRDALDERLMLFWTGRSHDSASILQAQRRDTQTRPTVVGLLHRLKVLAREMRDALEAGDLDDFGRLLDVGWRTKRQLSGAISSSEIDDWYATAKHAGAIGGKITGAGGGGYLLLYAPTERQHDVRDALGQCGLREMPFSLDMVGVTRLEQPPQQWMGRFDERGAGAPPVRAPSSA